MTCIFDYTIKSRFNSCEIWMKSVMNRAILTTPQIILESGWKIESIWLEKKEVIISSLLVDETILFCVPFKALKPLKNKVPKIKGKRWGSFLCFIAIHQNRHENWERNKMNGGRVCNHGLHHLSYGEEYRTCSLSRILVQ